jgi:hypothetical protein
VDSATPWRKTTQKLAPAYHTPTPAGQYDIYPGFPIGSGKIELGYQALADRLAGHRRVIIDGYGGVFWHNLRTQLDAVLTRRGIRIGSGFLSWPNPGH